MTDHAAELAEVLEAVLAGTRPVEGGGPLEEYAQRLWWNEGSPSQARVVLEAYWRSLEPEPEPVNDFFPALGLFGHDGEVVIYRKSEDAPRWDYEIVLEPEGIDASREHDLDLDELVGAMNRGSPTVRAAADMMARALRRAKLLTGTMMASPYWQDVDRELARPVDEQVRAALTAWDAVTSAEAGERSE